MLPGERAFTDEDIITVLGEAYGAFKQVVERYDVPELLHPALFGHAVSMVGQRNLPLPANTLEALTRGGKIL